MACTGGRTGQTVTCSDGKGWNFASESRIWLRRHQERMWLLLAAQDKVWELKDKLKKELFHFQAEFKGNNSNLGLAG